MRQFYGQQCSRCGHLNSLFECHGETDRPEVPVTGKFFCKCERCGVEMECVADKLQKFEAQPSTLVVRQPVGANPARRAPHNHQAPFKHQKAS